MKYFEYHCYEGEDSADAKLWHHTHQTIEVLDRQGDRGDGEIMYTVQFPDGYIGTAFEDEILASPVHYERPDYNG